MKLFVTGGTGQVGFELHRSLCVFGELLIPSRTILDLSDLDSVSAYLEAEKPELIVNAAAWTAVDLAESEESCANRLNTELPKLLASYAARENAWLIHYSSDYVYSGLGNQPWSETDETAPLSVYGRSKLAGDKVVENSGCRYLILRTSWVYSARGHNFMKTMLMLGAARTELAIVSDQIGAPTPARLIANITSLVVDRIIQNKPIDQGIYHLVSRGKTHWHEFACEIFRQAAEYLPLKIAPENVKSLATIDYPTPATRPANSILQVTKLEQALGIVLPEWRGQLTLTLAEYATIATSERKK